MKQKLMSLSGPALLFFLTFSSCVAQQPAFYEGLRLRAEAGEGDAAAKARAGAAAFFEKALNSPNSHIRQAAAEELLNMRSEGEAVPGPALEHARREAAGPWAAAFAALDADARGRLFSGSLETAQVKEKVLAFLLSSGETAGATAGSANRYPHEAARYTLRECRNKDADFFSAPENAAIEGRFAASRSRFSEALTFFRVVLTDDESLFLRYPDLLNDLGRSFQYAAAGTEGLDLFLEWEKNPSREPDGETRFRLLFFAARIARQRGLADRGIELFARALPFAPDSGQADACIWYILDSALGQSPAAAIRQLETFVTQWHSDAYFFDVLDKLAQTLVAKRQWKELLRVFGLIRQRPGSASAAQYAYILGRAIALGYFSPVPEDSPAEPVPASAQTAAYLRIAYDAGAASFYYRAQSAAALGRPFLELPAESGKTGAANRAKRSAAMEFLLGFFSNNAAGFASRYIRPLEQNLSAPELRVLAEAFAKADLYAESIRLVSAYTGREGYEPERRDLELHYPRPFKELVEQYAAETGIAPALLFGLIRTESAFQSDIVSRAGASGLTQLMPATANEMAGRIRDQGGPNYSETDQSGPNLWDPAINIHIGAAYLAYLNERMDDPLLALLAYNGGMNRIRRWRSAGSRRPDGDFPVDLFLETVEYPETREYGRKVLAAAAVYGYLYY